MAKRSAPMSGKPQITVHVDVAACIRWLFIGIGVLLTVYRSDPAGFVRMAAFYAWPAQVLSEHSRTDSFGAEAISRLPRG